MNIQSEDLFVAFAAISLASSATVVLTGIVFRDMMLSRRKPFSHLIFCISLCDLMSSIGNVLGYPQNGSTSCTVQAVLFLFFNRASWIFTTTLVFQLKEIMTKKKIWLRLSVVHSYTWLISLILTLLPLSTNNDFGIIDPLEGHSPCNIGGEEAPALIWDVVSFEGLALICFMLMAFFATKIATQFRKMQQTVTDREWALFVAVYLYPIAMVLTWLPPMSMAYVLLAYPKFDKSFAIYICSTIFSCLLTQYGTLTATIFFSHSKEARRKWGLLFGIVSGRMLSRPLLEESSYDLSSRGGISEQFDEEFCVDDNEDASERMSSVEVTIMGGPLKA